MIVDLQIEIKRFLESVYGLKVEDVRTTNYEGKRKRRKTGFYREIDYKKVNRRPNILTTAIDSPLKALCIWELHEQPVSGMQHTSPDMSGMLYNVCRCSRILWAILVSCSAVLQTRESVCTHLHIASTCRHMSH